MFAKGSFLLKLKHLAELAVVLPLFFLLKILPFAVSSFLLGKLLRLLGRNHKSHQTALKNIKHCFPEKTDAEIGDIALNSWENLGRIAGELPHIVSYQQGRMQELAPISGIENLEEAERFAKENNTGIVLMTAHIGNWELAARTALILDPETALIYRKANNPYVDALIQNLRGKYTDFIIPKGDKSGVRDILKHLKSGGSLAMLADQKISAGVDVRFFETTVKAPSSAGEFSLKYNTPVVTFRAVRDEIAKTSFVVKFDKPIYSEGRSPEEIMQLIYNNYERWIREYPNQWFWQHNRFELAKK